jgi:hypothetical protein
MADTSPPVAPDTAPEIVHDGAAFPPLLVAHCASTARWVRFLAVLTTVIYALLVLTSLGLGIAGIAVPARNPFHAAYGAGSSIVLLLTYVVVVGIYVPALVHLYRYTTALRLFVAAPDAARLERALGCQKSFWKYVGILCIVGLATLGLIVVLPLSRSAF